VANLGQLVLRVAAYRSVRAVSDEHLVRQKSFLDWPLTSRRTCSADARSSPRSPGILSVAIIRELDQSKTVHCATARAKASSAALLQVQVSTTSKRPLENRQHRINSRVAFKNPDPSYAPPKQACIIVPCALLEWAKQACASMSSRLHHGNRTAAKDS